MASEEAQMLPIDPPTARFEAVIQGPADTSREVDILGQGSPRPDGLSKLLAILPGQEGRSALAVARGGRQQKAEVPLDIKGKEIEWPSGLYMSSANRPATTPGIAAPGSAEPAIVHVPDATGSDASELPVGEAGHSQATGTAEENDEPLIDPDRASSLTPPVEDGVGKSKDSDVSIRDNSATQSGGIGSDQSLPPSQPERFDVLIPPGERAESQTSTWLPKLASVTTPLPTEVLQSTTASRDKEVVVPLSKGERVRTLQFRSSRVTMARAIVPNAREKQKLRTFSSFVGTANQPELFGRPLLQCNPFLVEIEESVGRTRTYICIEGLDNEKDIRNFHATMCRRSNRKYYDPWGLCFGKPLVLRSTSRTNMISAEHE